MYPVSDGFLAAVQDDHDPIVRVDIQDVTGAVLLSLDVVTGGQVAEDRTADIRSTFTVTLAGDDLDPTDVDDLLVPAGNELTPYRGVLVDGVAELVPLGVFGISRPQTDVTTSGTTISVNAYDRSRRVQRATLEKSWAILPGVRLDTALTAFLQDRWAFCPPIRSTVDATITNRVVWTRGGDQPWTLARDLATAYGAELYFDLDGVPVLNDLPSPRSQSPVATFGVGDLAVVASASRVIDDEGSFSGVEVVSDNTDAPFRSLAWDTDAASPTYYDGPFGRVAYQYVTSKVGSQFSADALATRLLPLYTGVLQQASWTQLVHPHLRAGDLIAYADSRTGFDGTYSIESRTIPLGVDELMTATVKERRLWLT